MENPKTPKTDAEVMEALRNDTPLNRARRVFSSFCASIEQAGAQRKPLDPIEWRRMEFEAVAQIAAALEAPSPPVALQPEALPAPAPNQDVGLMSEVVNAARRAGVRRLVLPGDAGARLVEELERSAAGRLVSRTDDPRRSTPPQPSPFGYGRYPLGPRDPGATRSDTRGRFVNCRYHVETNKGRVPAGENTEWKTPKPSASRSCSTCAPKRSAIGR